MPEQTIFRSHRTERDRWTPVLNETIRDKRLSFRATGLLVFLLSLPPDWRANQQHIATCKAEGRDAVITAWNELREFGYLEKEIVRERGQIVTTIWNVYETSRNPEKPETVQPETAEPKTAEPKTENPILRKTKGEEGHKETKPSADAETVAICFGQFWAAYPEKKDKRKAEIAFRKHHCFDKIEVILTALEAQKKTDQWQRGIIPHPTTWLNGHRWEDDFSNEKPRTTSNNSANSSAGGKSRGGEANATQLDQYAGLGRIH